MILTGGVAAAATGTLPDPVQNVASDAADVVGVNIPHGNHGADVSDAAHDKSGTDDGSNHGEDVSTVARDNHGHNKDTTSTTVAGDDDAVSTAVRATAADRASPRTPTRRTPARASSSGGDSKGTDDPAGHDANDDHGDDDSVTGTTVVTAPNQSNDDASGPRSR